MPVALIELDFDPLLHLGGRTIPLEIAGVAGVVLLVLLAAALIAGRTPAGDPSSGRELADAESGGEGEDAEQDLTPPQTHLRRDDVLLIGLAVLPGAVAGGRLVYGLIHLDYYTHSPAALTDPSLGSLSLSGAVLGGAITGAAVAHLLGPSLGRWLRAATVPMLLAVGVGKAVAILGGEGQGAPTDGPFAVRFGGAGPWPDPAAALVASHPSQLYEAVATGIVLLIVALLWASGRARSGQLLFGTALALWALARFAVAFTWRDPAIAGPLRAEQLVCLAIAAGGLGLVALGARRARRGIVVEAAGSA